MSISMADAIRAQVAGLDSGQKQFLANHLWKHYRVAPQKLREFIPEHVFEPEITLKKGDVVKVVRADSDVNECPAGRVGVVTTVDRTDLYLTYRVDWNGPHGAEWFKADQLQGFTPSE